MTHTGPTTGLRLPDLTLDPVRSGRAVRLRAIGRPALLILHGHRTSSASAEVNAPVRRVYADARHLLVASVVDLSRVPRLLRPMARPFMRRACDEARAQLPPGVDPDEYVVILVDGKGEVARALRLRPLDEQACVVLAGADGRVLGLHQGPQLAAAALRLLAEADVASSSD